MLKLLKMKKLILLLLLIALHVSLKAQVDTFSTLRFLNTYTNTITTGVWSGNYRSGFVHETNGSINFGLNGNKASGFRFRWLAHDNGDVDYGSDTDLLMQLSNTGDLVVMNNGVFGNVTANSFSKLVIRGANAPANENGKRDLSYEFVSAGKAIVRAYRGASWDTYLQFMTSPYSNLGGEPSVRMHITGDGNVGIGTTTPQAKLAVAGDVFAKKVKVTQNGWPDYVFNDHYELPSLQEVSAYIQTAHHLPGVPSAAIIEKDGLDLGEMQKIQMQKIEELTLYMIALKQENDLLKSRMADMEAALKQRDE